MKFGALFLTALLGIAMLCLAACSGGGGTSSTSTPAGTPVAAGTPQTSVDLVAKNLKYNTDSITLAPNTETTVTLDNKDASVLHNFSIYTTTDATTTVFKGDLTTGPTTMKYTIPPLQPGTYYFRCDVHPDTMHGTLIVP